MNRFLITTVLLPAALLAPAQTATKQHKNKSERRVPLVGNVWDSFTKARLPAHIKLMRADSTIVDSMIASLDDGIMFAVPVHGGKYIVRAECDGYEPVCMSYTMRPARRNLFMKLPDITLKRRHDDIYKEVSIDGVVVTGTKVKFAYRGDTLVYNASAFNVPDGSMLDAIVRQLPGTELKNNGDIFVNGKKIDYLLLNGKDFFSGKNKIMLENLPYFTVNEIKVYDKSTERSRFIGHDVERKDYVMDVAMKREYSRGYIANAEAAAGTKQRYMARLFGLRYTNQSRMSLFGNVNNVNENRRPGKRGDWTPANMPEGQTATKQAGADISTQTRGEKVQEHFNAVVTWSDADNTTRRSAQSFASTGDIFSRNTGNTRQKEFRIDGKNELVVTNGATFFITDEAKLEYSDGKSTAASSGTTSTGAMRDELVNRSQTMSRKNSRYLNVGNDFSLMFKLPWGDRLEAALSGEYNRTRPDDRFSGTHNEYVKQQTADVRNVYANLRRHAYQYKGKLAYVVAINNLEVEFNNYYRQNFRSSNNLNYRLDRLGNRYSSYEADMIGSLPQTADSLLMALDAANSNHYTWLRRDYEANLHASYSGKGNLLMLDLGLHRDSERMNYHHAALDTTAQRRRWVFTPSAYYSHTTRKWMYDVNLSMSNTLPDFAELMPVTNDINPLAIHVGNPDLKPTKKYRAKIGVTRRNLFKRYNASFGIEANTYRDFEGTRTSYDESTGAYTYKRDNVGDGNWNIKTRLNFSGPLDKAKLLSVDNAITFNYTKSTDFDIAYGSLPAALSRVCTSEVRDRLNITYQKADLTLTVGGDVQWRHSSGDRPNFATLNTWDYNYGATLTCKLPLGISLATDLKEFCRRGYGESYINTSDLVWNASLARSFCKGKLTLTAEAFDILHQLSSTTYAVNAQGRTETWRNTIPSYGMMKVAYKFTMAPKSKK